ncbi:hypothetical protein KNO81_39870, partial [Paraburkholderia sediminicola]|nr:hypothetical protein [Paraburkholderia sediminicola]
SEPILLLACSSYFRLRSNTITVDSATPLYVRWPTALRVFRYESTRNQVVDVSVLVQVIHVHTNKHSFVQLNRNAASVDLAIVSGEQHGIRVDHFIEVDVEI